MIKRCLEISGGPTFLAMENRQLVLSRGAERIGCIPIEDLGVLIVDHPACTYTHGVLTAMAENNVAVVLGGPTHHPAAMLLPVEGNSLQGEAANAQAAASAALKGRLWREIVRAKIAAQGEVVARRGREAGAFRELARRVRAGDPENLEAQAARRYWSAAFAAGFRRDRRGDPPNNLLNYGYMVLRAAVARAIAGAGLWPSLGIHHRNRYNAFALADDLMEPLRPAVDLVVLKLWDHSQTELSRQVRSSLIETLAAPVNWRGQRSPLMVALARYAASVREVFAHQLARPQIPRLPPPDEEQT
jgi:CRISPR-associated protein Cas1